MAEKFTRRRFITVDKPAHGAITALAGAVGIGVAALLTPYKPFRFPGTVEGRAPRSLVPDDEDYRLYPLIPLSGRDLYDQFVDIYALVLLKILDLKQDPKLGGMLKDLARGRLRLEDYWSASSNRKEKLNNRYPLLTAGWPPRLNNDYAIKARLAPITSDHLSEDGFTFDAYWVLGTNIQMSTSFNFSLKGEQTITSLYQKGVIFRNKAYWQTILEPQVLANGSRVVYKTIGLNRQVHVSPYTTAYTIILPGLVAVDRKHDR